MGTDSDRERLRAELGDDFADVSEAKDALWDEYERNPRSLHEVQQAVLDAWVLSGLVGNGGFDLWIRSSGHRAAETAHGLRLLGMGNLASVVDQAVEVVGRLDGADETRRHEAVDALSEADIDRLDSLSVKIWDADSALEQAMARAVRAHRDLFPHP